jgi:hypothetical protein
MIKGVRIGGIGKTLSYLDTLMVPIIENTPNEEDLKDSMAEVGILSFSLLLSDADRMLFVSGNEEVPGCSRSSRTKTWSLCLGYVKSASSFLTLVLKSIKDSDGSRRRLRLRYFPSSLCYMNVQI